MFVTIRPGTTASPNRPQPVEETAYWPAQPSGFPQHNQLAGFTLAYHGALPHANNI